MIWLFVLAVYLLGWFPAAVFATRSVAQNPIPYCHAGGYSRSTCRKYDRPECWRVDKYDGSVSVGHLAAGCGLGLVWPALLPVLGVYRAAKPSSKRLMTDRELAALEREAGL